MPIYTLNIRGREIPIIFDRDNGVSLETLMNQDNEFAEKVGVEIAKLIIKLTREAMRLDENPFKDIPNPLENDYQWP